MKTGSLLNLRKFLVPEIVYGQGARQLCGRHALNLGASRVCIVTDPGVKATSWYADVEISLRDTGLPFAVFDQITPNPKAYEVAQGARLCREERCDLIIAIGGGSPMDCAKGIGVLMGNSGNILDYEGVDMVPNPGPPLIFIPTTAGSSADVSQFAIITDMIRNIKIAIISKMVIPDIALIDPETTLTMSPELTADTGMDTLCHAFEAFVSTASSPITDLAAISAVELTWQYLKKAYDQPDNLVYREKMMTASLMAGLAFSNASLGLVHAMAHSLGGAMDLPHGECNAILLEKVVRFNYDTVPDRYDRLAAAMGLDICNILPGERGNALAKHIAGLRTGLGITQTLEELGVKQTDLSRLARFAFQDPCLSTNPRPADETNIENLYAQALH